jgi:hypothetical protein
MLKRILILLVVTQILIAQEHVAILKFEGSGMSPVDAANITDRFSYEISKTNKFILIERELLNQIIEEQKTQLSGCVADECAVEVGRLSGARMVIAGKVSKTFGLYSISARLIDVETGEIVAQVLESDEQDVKLFFSQRVKNAALKLAAEGSQVGAGGSNDSERITSAEKGIVVFSLSKEDAGIFIDGSYSSQASGTNVTLQLSEGTHDIKFAVTGYRDWVKQVNVLVGETLSYEVKFTAGSGSSTAVVVGAVVVRSTPGNATVLIDGIEKGPTPQQVTSIGVGTHLIRVEMPLYHPYIEEVNVVADGVNQVQANLLPKFGSLSITSVPSGAAVYLNDQLKGKTPLEIAQVASGDYTIKLAKELYYTHEEKFTITDGSDSQRPIILSPAFGTLTVSSNPVGAEVYVDGQLKGKSPTTVSELPSGEYRLSVQMSLYETLETEIIIEDGKTNQQTIVLAPRFGTLNITGSPTGASIKANGSKIGTIPMVNYHIGTGSVELTIQLDNYYAESQFIQIATEEFYPLSIDLVPHTGTVLAFTEPPDAMVFLDDHQIGPSPQIIKDVPVGSHLLQLRHPSFLEVTESFNLKIDERKEFKLNLITYEGSVQQEIDNLTYKRNVSIGTGVGLAVLAASLKSLSNSKYSEYEDAVNPDEISRLYDLSNTYNDLSGVSLSLSILSFTPAIYYEYQSRVKADKIIKIRQANLIGKRIPQESPIVLTNNQQEGYELIVTTEPTKASAELYSDGVRYRGWVGTNHFKGLPPGKYSLRVVALGYDDYYRDFSIGSERVMKINVKLLRPAEFYKSFTLKDLIISEGCGYFLLMGLVGSFVYLLSLA